MKKSSKKKSPFRSFNGFNYHFDLNIEVIDFDALDNLMYDNLKEDQKIYLRFQKEIFLVKKWMINLVKNLLDYNEDYASRIKIMGNKIWSEGPTIFFLKEIAKTTKKKIILDEKADYLFTKGKDVFLKSIENPEVFRNENIELSDPVIVMDKNNFCLGIGTSKIIDPSSKVLSKKNMETSELVAVKNSINIGHYLRV